MTYGNYPCLESVKRVLVIKLRHFGDVLLSTPVFSNLKKAMPNAEIDAYVYKETFSILENNPDISNILQYDREWKKLSFLNRMIKELNILRAIRKGKYDLVINLTEGDRGAIAAKASHAKIAVGFDPGKSGMKGKRKIFSYLVKQPSLPRHTVEKNLDALRKIGIFPKAEDKKLTLVIPDVAKEKMHLLLQKYLCADFILIHPASRWRFKCWDINAMQMLSKKLIQQGHKLLFVSANNDVEKQMVAEIVKDLDSSCAFNLSGQLSLQELAALIDMSKLLLCVDSLPLHMASALQANCLALFGPTSDITWGPWMNPNGRVVTEKISCRPCSMDGCGGSKMSDCLYSLSVERVLCEVEKLL